MCASGAGLLARAIFITTLSAQSPYLSNLPLDRYGQGEFDNPVTRLHTTVTDLPSLLRALDIDPDSQALVFSRTSFQASRIGPRNPRAIYFNDEAAVGWVRGGQGIEVAAFDRYQGMVFYTLQDGRFTRREECLHCHHGAATAGVPGIFIGSVFPDAAGNPSRDRAIITDHRTPFADRWGGWYVNAARGHQPDRSNAVAEDPADPHLLTPLRMSFTPDGYLRATSDIVALMTFEHQTQMTNLLTRLNWDAGLGLPLDADLDATVRYMLFQDEVPLKEPVEGASAFARHFAERGPRDRQGRGLREFDLRTRLFRYSLSYMIYSPAFDALPAAIRARIYSRIRASCAPEVIAILSETKPGFAERPAPAGQ
jgi:hypothetical protein